MKQLKYITAQLSKTLKLKRYQFLWHLTRQQQENVCIKCFCNPHGCAVHNNTIANEISPHSFCIFQNHIFQYLEMCVHVQLCLSDTKCICVYDATLNMLNGVLINSSRDIEVKGRWRQYWKYISLEPSENIMPLDRGNETKKSNRKALNFLA